MIHVVPFPYLGLALRIPESWDSFVFEGVLYRRQFRDAMVFYRVPQ
jgi:hypothetical protein